MLNINIKSSDTLNDTLHGILNFRDFGDSTENPVTRQRYIKEGLVFRSATMDHMSNENVEAFIKEHRISTIIDLRTDMEGLPGLPIDKSFPTMAAQDVQAKDLVASTTGWKYFERAPEKTRVDDYTNNSSTFLRKKIRINYAGKNFQRYCVFMSCSLRLKITILLLMLFCQKKKAVYIVGRDVLSPMGVSVMYKQLTLHCKSEIRHSLDVFTDPKNYPIHIHCSHGKDRTGILACLVQSIAGVPEEIIVRDYARTQKELEPVRDILLKEIRDSGFSDEFAETPPKNMEYLLHHFNSTYGSVDGYLDSVGFDEECREKVRKIICVE